MSETNINYSALIDEAMHIIVKKSLEIISKKYPIGEHHFFISFITKFPGVKLSERLVAKYPEEMTIVLQHQFEDLTVGEKDFSVTLSFNKVKERLIVPYAALTSFADPSVNFALQFQHIGDHTEMHIINEVEEESTIQPEEAENNIISLDFKNKRKKDH